MSSSGHLPLSAGRGAMSKGLMGCYVICRKGWLLSGLQTVQSCSRLVVQRRRNSRIQRHINYNYNWSLFWGRLETSYREPWIQYFLCLRPFGAGTWRACCSFWSFSSWWLIISRTDNQPASLRHRGLCQSSATYSLWTTSDYMRALCR